MPARVPLLPTLARLAVYVAALLVLATARLPDAPLDTAGTAVRIAAPPAESGTGVPVRLLLAGVLVTGIAVELLRRRAIWH